MQLDDSIRWTSARLLVSRAIRDEGPMLGWDVHLATGLHRNTVNRVVHYLHAAGILYIFDWGHPGESNMAAPIWAIKVSESQRDARRPKRKPKSAINRDWNAKNRAYKIAQQRAARGAIAGVWSGLL